MDLVRSWVGQALRATGAAVVVPVAILFALSLTAIGGSGLGGLGALTQVVSGPRVPGSDLTVDNGDTEIGDAVGELAARSTDDTGALGLTPGGGVAPGTGGGGGQTPAGTLPGPGGGGGEGPGGGTNPPPGGGGGGGGGGTPEPPGPPPPEPPGVVEGVGQTVKDVTAGTPVAPTIEDAVDGLVEACGRLGCP